MAIRQFIKYKSQTLAEAQWTHVIETLTGWLLICKKFKRVNNARKKRFLFLGGVPQWTEWKPN